MARTTRDWGRKPYIPHRCASSECINENGRSLNVHSYATGVKLDLSAPQVEAYHIECWKAEHDEA